VRIRLRRFKRLAGENLGKLYESRGNAYNSRDRGLEEFEPAVCEHAQQSASCRSVARRHTGVQIQRRTDREKAGYKGPVREVTVETHEPAGTARETWLFDRSGTLLVNSFRGPDGTESRIEPRTEKASEPQLDNAGGWSERYKLPADQNLIWAAIEG